MAGKSNVKVIDADTDAYVDYKGAAARYEKLENAARKKASEIEEQRKPVEAQAQEVLGNAAKALEQVDEAKEAVRLHDRYIKSLEQQHEALGKELDAAEAANDADKIKELNDRYTNEQIQIARERDQLGEYQAKLDAAEGTASALNDQHLELTRQLSDSRREQIKYEVAATDYGAAQEMNEGAARTQDLANVAAGGDPAQIRTAMLAEADRLADRYHQVAKDHAESFEKLRQEEIALKTMQDEEAISSREQAKLEAKIVELEKAGRTEEAESIHKELDWRAQRTIDLRDRIATKQEEVESVKMLADMDAGATAYMKKQSEEMRELANAKPEVLEKRFNEELARADKEINENPVDPENVELSKELETEPVAQNGEAPAEPSAEAAPAESVVAQAENGEAPPADPAGDLDDLPPTQQTGTAEETENSTGEAPAPVIVDREMLHDEDPTAIPSEDDTDLSGHKIDDETEGESEPTDLPSERMIDITERPVYDEQETSSNTGGDTYTEESDDGSDGDQGGAPESSYVESEA